MSHFFYKYDVYNDQNGVERTVLKWIEDGIYDDTAKIDKPTADLTAEDQAMLDHFFEEGGVVQNKIDFPIPPDESTIGM
jgi:hypothetical protein